MVELVGEDVFVVGEGDDELDDQHATASHHCTASAPVGVFPTDTLVLFVQTDDIWVDLAFTVIVDDDGVEVLDDTQAITSQRQVVRAVAGATVAKIKGLFALEGWAGVCVRYSHLRN